MNNFIPLTCPSCGTRLQISNDLEQFACGSCGNEYVVRRGGGVISLEPLIQRLEDVQEDTSHMVSELAIQRLRTDKREHEQNIRKLKKQLEDDKYKDMILRYFVQRYNFFQGFMRFQPKKLEGRLYELYEMDMAELEKIIAYHSEEWRFGNEKRLQVLALLEEIKFHEEALIQIRRNLCYHEQIVNN